MFNDLRITIDYYSDLRLLNTIVRLVFFLTITYLIAALKASYQREKNLAQTDGLTGIINRRYFLNLLRQELNLALRYEKIFTLAYLDLDNFKMVNDRFGHDRGDELLRLVARTTLQTIRQTDIFARLGGDEFALLLPETEFKDAQIALQRLQTKLLAAMERHSFPITFSIGAVTFLKPTNSVDEIIQKADALMYRVKKSGKDNLKHELYG
ncbi:GGDEF domain-containing protein [Myxosarcina sp. GI1(2024)]